MFLIFKCYFVYPNFNEVVSIGSNLIWTVAICPNIYNISRGESKPEQPGTPFR